VAYGPGQASSPVVAAGTAPAVNPEWLAGSADRERAVGVLRAGFAEGRLTQDELTDRVGRAYAARTYRELWALTADLPSGPLPVPTGPVHGALPWHGGYDPTAQDLSPTKWRSSAALVFTALVIFVLAALVTLAVSSHSGSPVPGQFQQEQPVPAGPGQVVLEPHITPVEPGGHRVFHAAPAPPSP
jgi:hypothetical protein